MRKVYRFLALAVPLLFLAPAAAVAQKDNCIDCRHKRCLADLAEQKEAFANGYDALAAKWESRVMEADEAVDTVDFSKYPDAAVRDGYYAGIVKLIQTFQEDANRMASRIGAPESCGFTEDLEVSTETLTTCRTDQAELNKAQSAAPCSQIADLIDQHEKIHRDACNARLLKGAWEYAVPGISQTRVVPQLMNTPAGMAREEASAYRMEAAAYHELAEQARRDCDPKPHLSAEKDHEARPVYQEKLRRAAERVKAYGGSIK